MNRRRVTRLAMAVLAAAALASRGLADVTLDCAVLLGFTALFFAVGLWRFDFD